MSLLTVGVQIATKQIDEGIAAGLMAAEAGATWLDLNCGCPIYGTSITRPCSDECQASRHLPACLVCFLMAGDACLSPPTPFLTLSLCEGHPVSPSIHL